MRVATLGWMVLLSWGLFAGGAVGQQVSGVFSVSGAAGYQTNLYLDPVLGEWDPDATPAFLAVDPTAGLVYSTPTVQLHLRGTARVYPYRAGHTALPLVRLSGAGRYTFARQWTAGFYGGGSRYRLQPGRDAWWALPSLAWRPTTGTTLELRGGLAGRHSRFPEETVRQTSAVGMLRGATWLTDRLHGQVSLYRSTSRAAAGTAAYGGTGAAVALTFRGTNRLALTGRLGLDRLHYETETTQEAQPAGGSPIGIGDPSGGTVTTTTTTADRLWRAGAEVSWTLGSGLTLFARGQSMMADLASSEAPAFDVHAGGGVRWQIARTLHDGRSSTRSRDLWRRVEHGVRFQVRYQGAGQLYVTGDFNNWASPGIPLRPSGAGQYAATVPLEPGRYEYRIRIEEDGEEARWLAFPEAAWTVRDGFGGENGVCIVE